MQSTDPSSEIALIQSRLDALTQAFDLAVAKDAELGDLKKIFHELRIWQHKLEQVNYSLQKDSE